MMTGLTKPEKGYLLYQGKTIPHRDFTFQEMVDLLSTSFALITSYCFKYVNNVQNLSLGATSCNTSGLMRTLPAVKYRL